MPIVVTVAGFDTSDLIVDLSIWLSEILGWAELYQTIIPLDSIPLEAINIETAAKQVGALLVAVDFNQPAPEYGSDSYLAEPDESSCRVSLEQFVSGRSEDRELLVSRRTDLIRVLSPLNGTIP